MVDAFWAGETPSAGGKFELELLDEFMVRVESNPVRLTTRTSRLVARLALHGGTVGRGRMAGDLWPEATEHQAQDNLRSTLLRTRRDCPGLVQSGPHHLSLAPDVTIDFVGVLAWCRRTSDRQSALDTLTLPRFSRCPTLLRGWDDEWTSAERDNLQRSVLHAIETLTARLVDAGRAGEAATVAAVAVATDPLRESARRALICAQLAQGNRVEALSEYRRFVELLNSELGVRPTEQLTNLVTLKR